MVMPSTDDTSEMAERMSPAVAMPGTGTFACFAMPRARKPWITPTSPSGVQNISTPSRPKTNACVPVDLTRAFATVVLT